MTKSPPSRRKPGPAVAQARAVNPLSHRSGKSPIQVLAEKWVPAFAGTTVIFMLAGCTVGPDYQRPTAPISAVYKEAGWQLARPADAMDRGAWWSVYHDPVLDGLERQIDISNQNLRSALARFRQAEAIVTQARASFFPTEQISASASRSRGGGGGGSAGNLTTTSNTNNANSTSSGNNSTSTNSGAVRVSTGSARGGGGSISSFFSLTESASWVPDLWGRVERTVEGDVASAQASAGDVASARLAAQAQLASNYMQLRIADELKRLLTRSAAAYRESLRISQNQYSAGIVAASDVAQARTQLESTQAQAVAVGVLRSQLEHAIAALTGRPPAELSIAAVETVPPLPDVPAGLPSELLERRPDIAAAERRMAAANAQIGVAETAFFPTITLSADSGVASTMLASLFSASSRVWSFGSNLAQIAFDAGSRHATVEQNRAAFEGTVADYRQAVLTGLQQVEDQLAALRILAEQAAAQEIAVTSAQEAERIIFNQYKAGTVPFTNVVVAQTAALANAQTAVNIRQSRLLASVALIQGLGGGWDTSRIPSREQVETDIPLNFSPFAPPDAEPRPALDWLPKLW